MSYECGRITSSLSKSPSGYSKMLRRPKCVSDQPIGESQVPSEDPGLLAILRDASDRIAQHFFLW